MPHDKTYAPNQERTRECSNCGFEFVPNTVLDRNCRDVECRRDRDRKSRAKIRPRGAA